MISDRSSVVPQVPTDDEESLGPVLNTPRRRGSNIIASKSNSQPTPTKPVAAVRVRSSSQPSEYELIRPLKHRSDSDDDLSPPAPRMVKKPKQKKANVSATTRKSPEQLQQLSPQKRAAEPVDEVSAETRKRP